MGGRYLFLEQAAAKYRLPLDFLTQAAQRGLIRAARINGHLAVSEEDVRHLSQRQDADTVPQYIPLAEALRRFRISEEALKEAISSGRIRTATIGEEVAVAEQDVRELAKGQEVVVVRREDFEHLRGNRLGISEAARKYGLRQPTLSHWVRRGIVNVLGRDGNKILVDEADVAYAATVYRLKGGRQGMRIFDKEGRPYQPRSRAHRAERIVIVE